MVTAEQARSWLDRWDRQQEVYIADREERFAVIADVVAATTDRPTPLVLDIGAGPGSLSVRLLERMPFASVVAIDADPLLLALARSAYGDRDGLRIVARDLRDPRWSEDLPIERPVDAVVSTTALHWLTRDELAQVYGAVATLLRPGGVLVDGDHFSVPEPGLDRLTRVVREHRAERVGLAAAEDWEQWWDAVGDAPELADLTRERGARPIDHAVPELPLLPDHVGLLKVAGFAEVGTVWQHGDDRVLVALR